MGVVSGANAVREADVGEVRTAAELMYKRIAPHRPAYRLHSFPNVFESHHLVRIVKLPSGRPAVKIAPHPLGSYANCPAIEFVYPFLRVRVGEVDRVAKVQPAQIFLDQPERIPLGS